MHGLHLQVLHKPCRAVSGGGGVLGVTGPPPPSPPTHTHMNTHTHSRFIWISFRLGGLRTTKVAIPFGGGMECQTKSKPWGKLHLLIDDLLPRTSTVKSFMRFSYSVTPPPRVYVSAPASHSIFSISKYIPPIYFYTFRLRTRKFKSAIFNLLTIPTCFSSQRLTTTAIIHYDAFCTIVACPTTFRHFIINGYTIRRFADSLTTI